MIVRSLPVGEWERLRGVCELGDAVPFMDPSRATIMVVEDGDRIVGCWALLTMEHAEGVWIHPDYRQKTSVARRLWRFMQQLARERGVTRVQTGACEPVIAALLERHGATKLEMDSYILPVRS